MSCAESLLKQLMFQIGDLVFLVFLIEHLKLIIDHCGLLRLEKESACRISGGGRQHPFGSTTS